MIVNLWPTNGMNGASGYGRMEIGLANGLKAAGADVALSYPDYLGDGDVTIVVGSPEWCERMPKGRRVWCYTMSESDRPSPEWVAAMNQWCERVLVPCPELVAIYERAGVTVPVSYVPLGMDYGAPKHVERAHKPKEFVWLTYSLGDMRKGAEQAIFAFNRLFSGNKRHKLIVKCRDNPMWLTGINDPQISIQRGETSSEDWHELLGMCHAMIYPSRGEGWGYPPREAVMSGMPVIATQALGMWDADCWGWPLRVKEMRPCQMDFWEANAEGAQWWEPDWGHIGEDGKVVGGHLDEQMRAIHADYPAALARARRGREYLRMHFTWEETARKILRLMA